MIENMAEPVDESKKLQAYENIKEPFDKYLAYLYGSVQEGETFFEDPIRLVGIYAMYETFIGDFTIELESRKLRLAQGRDGLFELRELDKSIVAGYDKMIKND